MATDYERLYHTKRWERRSLRQRHESPLCVMCFEKGIITAADLADHIEPHHGDLKKFYFGPLQSLCWQCHAGPKQAQEKSGRDFDTAIGADGWPIDKRHPANARE
jgi:hypothetical protein